MSTTSKSCPWTVSEHLKSTQRPKKKPAGGCQTVAKNASFACISRFFAAFKFPIKIPHLVEDAGFKWVQGLDCLVGLKVLLCRRCTPR